MNNIKGYSIAQDGNMKRIIVTYDIVDDETGKPISLNNKINQFVTNATILKTINKLGEYAQGIVDAE